MSTDIYESRDGDDATDPMELRTIPVDDIEPNPNQPREEFDDDKLDNLARTIDSYKLVNPIKVRPAGEDTDADYQITAGERRWRSVKRAGEREIRALVTEVNDADQQVESLIENLHREDLSATEKGKGILRAFVLEGVKIDTENGDYIEELADDVWSVYRCKENGTLYSGSTTPNESGSYDDRLRKLDTVMERVGTNGKAVKRWLENATASPHIQQEQTARESDEQVASTTVGRITKIEDEDLGDEVYDKISADGMPKEQGRIFTVTVDNADEPLREVLLDPETQIDTKKMKAVRNIEDPETAAKTYEKIFEQGMNRDEAQQFATAIETVDPETRDEVLAEGVRVDPETFGEPDELDVELTPEEQQALQQRIEQTNQRIEEILNDPDVIERKALRLNSHSHLEAANQRENLQCPLCGNGPEHLVWSCEGHDDIPLVQAAEVARQNYQESLNRRTEDESYREWDGGEQNGGDEP